MKLNKKLNGLAQEGGFTLIEMLIVVAIIAILVAIAVPALSTAKDDAQNAKRNAVLSAIALAKNRYALAPATTDANIATFNGATTANKLGTLGPYMLINGVSPAGSNALNQVLDGTGHTTLTIGNIDRPSTSPADETSNPAIPARGTDT